MERKNSGIREHSHEFLGGSERTANASAVPASMSDECVNCRRVRWVEGEDVVDDSGNHFCGQNCLWSFQLAGAGGSNRPRKNRARNNMQAGHARDRLAASNGPEIARSIDRSLNCHSPPSDETQNAMFDFHKTNFGGSYLRNAHGIKAL
mmetsp:Transcript_10042/g.18103  ORF Transcript_10042/g.18103 Transcript_10042/m.18103 type:complete len:149 (-) Transcript_10042:2016-2462(-)